jgi:hypothetical protein
MRNWPSFLSSLPFQIRPVMCWPDAPAVCSNKPDQFVIEITQAAERLRRDIARRPIDAIHVAVKKEWIASLGARNDGKIHNFAFPRRETPAIPANHRHHPPLLG